MKFKYIGQGHTNFSFKGEKIEVLENEIVDIDCDNDFKDYLSKNMFIEIKMDDEIEIKSKKK